MTALFMPVSANPTAIPLPQLIGGVDPPYGGLVSSVPDFTAKRRGPTVPAWDRSLPRDGALEVEPLRPMFAGEIQRQRVSKNRVFRQCRWHLDQVYVKLYSEMIYLWRAVDQEG